MNILITGFKKKVIENLANKDCRIDEISLL